MKKLLLSAFSLLILQHNSCFSADKGKDIKSAAASSASAAAGAASSTPSSNSSAAINSSGELFRKLIASNSEMCVEQAGPKLSAAILDAAKGKQNPNVKIFFILYDKATLEETQQLYISLEGCWMGASGAEVDNTGKFYYGVTCCTMISDAQLLSKAQNMDQNKFPALVIPSLKIGI